MNKLDGKYKKFLYVILVVAVLNPIATGFMIVNATPEMEFRNEAPEGFDPAVIQNLPMYDLDRKIAIIYDETNDDMTETAIRVYHSASSVYRNIEFIAFDNFEHLKMYIKSDDYFAKLYFVDLKLDGLYITDKFYSWDTFIGLIQDEKKTHQVFGAGTTNVLAQRIHDNNSTYLHIEGSDVIDMELSYFYYLWELGEIIGTVDDQEYYQASEDFKVLGSQYMANNLERMVNSQFEPNHALGEEDPEAKAAAWQKELEDMKDLYQITPDGKTIPMDQLKQLTLDGNAPDTIFRMLPASDGLSADQEDDFKIVDIPLFSGLEGPAAKVVDTVLEVLITAAGGALGLDPDTATQIVNLVKQLAVFISDTTSGKGDVKDTLRSLLETLLKEAPIPEQLKAFLPLIVDAFFLLRGEAQDIIDFGKNTIKTIFEQAGSLVNSTVLSGILTVLEEVLLSSVDLAERLVEAENEADAEGKSFKLMSEIQSFMLEKVMNFSIYSFVTELVEGAFPESEIVQEISQLTKLIIPIVKAFVQQDYSQLFEIAPDIVEYLVDKLSSTSFSLSDPLKSGLSFVMKAFQTAIVLFNEYTEIAGDVKELLVGDGSIADEIRNLFEELFKLALDFIGESAPTEEIEQAVTVALAALREWARVGVDSFDSMVSTFEGIIDNLVGGVDSVLRSIISQALAILASIIGVGDVPLPTFSDFQEIIQLVINYITGEAVLSADQESISTLLTNSFNDILTMVFGLIAIVSDGGPAQMLFVEASDIEGGQLTFDAKQRIFNDVGDAIVNLINNFLGDFIPESASGFVEIVKDLFVNILTSITSSPGDAIQSILQSILMQAINVFLSQTLGIDGSVAAKMIVSFFSNFLSGQTIGASLGEVLTLENLKALVESAMVNASQSLKDLAVSGIELLFNIDQLFTNTMDFIFGQLKSLVRTVLTDIFTKITGKISSLLTKKPLLEFGGGIPFAGADFLGIELKFLLKLTPNLKWDNEGFVNWMVDIIFEGSSAFGSSIGGFFKQILSFLEITPIFDAEFSIKSMSSGKGGLFSTILGFLGVDLSFSGEIYFSLQLFSFQAGGFEPGGFIKLLKWGLTITMTLSRDFTIIDVVTAGAGGGALNKAAKYIGLDTLVITFSLGMSFEIVFIAAQNSNPAQTRLTLTLTVGASIKVGFDLAIVGLTLSAGIKVTLKFNQDLAKDLFKITLEILFWVKVKLKFLFWDWTGKFEFRPPGSPYDLTPKSQQELQEQAFGFDLDADGLSDLLEANDPLLDPNNPDTDGDGLNDKIELRVTKSDPSNKDTDGDGLTDFQEWVQFKTDLLRPDTDLDGLDDFTELMVIGTNALSPDTDDDGLTDFFEATTDWDIEGVTTSVAFVTIGDKQYDTRTDPLNPDTDADGLIDGEEGVFGSYYGELENYYPEGDNWYNDPDNPGIDPALIFNDGYTHPLDNDTDDDSYQQYHTGEIAGFGANRAFLRDMRDGIEVAGITEIVVEVDEDGFQELVQKTFFTNPTNPDSDGDTATGNPRTKTEGVFLNSDGYELALDPALNPLDADVDGDGLVDGLEGTLRFDRISTTNPTNPDTDGDGLPDGLEFTLGSDPANPDTDSDLVLDGDEFYLYHTSPFLSDTDFDGLTDGWELFFSHSNPHSKDSDADGLDDAEEVLIWGTDPVDEDSDNDNLSDRDEVLDYETDPNNDDSDGDLLKDSEEVLIYFTDPFNIDSDGDSILYPDENGDPTFLLTDYLEIKVYHSDPLSKDTDLDGLDDSWEIYLAEFDIPGQANIAVDWLNNDTDNDGIIDGHEMQVNKTANLVYPYFALTLTFPFSSSPVLSDTDFDLLSDQFEWDNNMNLNSTDTDGDGLPDYDELFIHLTDPTSDDTDGDGISDSEELTMAEETLANNSTLHLTQDYSPLYATSASVPDTDGDGWPDGLEIHAEDNSSLYNPYVDDVNQNGILDGYERDFDSDMISDGDEYYTYNSYEDTHGGFMDYRNPDSDSDGLMDGDEILEYGTLPYSADSDFDTYSDGLELLVGTDPMVFTSEEDFLDAVRRMNSPLQIRSPEHGRTYLNGEIEIQAVSAVDLENAWFRYRIYDPKNLSHGDWSEEYAMSYKQVSTYALGSWESNAVIFENNTIYQVEVVGVATEYRYPTGDQDLKDVEFRVRSVFAVNNTYWLGVHPGWWVAGGSVVVISAIMAILTRRGVISPGAWVKKRFKRGGN